MTFGYGFLIFVFGLAIGAGLQAVYPRGFSAGEKVGVEGGVKLSEDELTNIYWLATNGFHRLLILGEKGSAGFQTIQQAEEAHSALERLEYQLPKSKVGDASFDRMGKITLRWPDGPLSPPRQKLRQEWLNKEP